ncbi:MAG: helix-turn-helix domain-containing protein [Oscillospiraceae bacterium]|jgi:transcriptional regulator with XRE-family HTH domain|nr:helix-turn-helix domain-containing protein [Oscillospiraceae bacterium]
MENTTLDERIRHIIAETGLKKAAFARSLGVTPNYIYVLCGGRVKNISPSLAMLIEQKYGFPADWVATGETQTSEAARELSDRLRGLDDKTLKALNRFLDRKLRAIGKK